MPQTKTVPAAWKQVIDSDTIARSLSRISYEILEKDRNIENLAIVGIRTNGEYLAKRIHKKISEIEKTNNIDYGVIDITLYRDDLTHASESPIVKGTDLEFKVNGARIVLVDDVFYTGRTIRAALDALSDFGRPACVELAVLVDRGHRELPIRADYVGKNLPTKREEFVRCRLQETGYIDSVYLINKND